MLANNNTRFSPRTTELLNHRAEGVCSLLSRVITSLTGRELDACSEIGSKKRDARWGPESRYPGSVTLPPSSPPHTSKMTKIYLGKEPIVESLHLDYSCLELCFPGTSEGYSQYFQGEKKSQVSGNEAPLFLECIIEDFTLQCYSVLIFSELSKILFWSGQIPILLHGFPTIIGFLGHHRSSDCKCRAISNSVTHVVHAESLKGERKEPFYFWVNLKS